MLLAALALLPACSPLGIVDAITPATGYADMRSLSYGPDPRQRVDLYHPTDPDPAAPVIVFFYGGGWKTGARADYRFVTQSLAEAGYTVAVPDYRLYPAVAFPAFVEDGAAAVAAVARSTGRSVVLMGHSAGAHLAVTLTLDRRWLAAAGVDIASTVDGTIGLAGPYDFAPISDSLRPILAPTGDMAASQPITHARGDAPPLLLIHGETDLTVRSRNAASLAAAVEAAGGDATVITYPRVGHASLVGAFAGRLGFLAPTRDDVLAWLDRRGG
jgi:acetyl esterase/lipase